MQLPEAEDLAKPSEERKIVILGIFLAIRGVDRFQYRRENGTNINVFEVRTAHE